MKDRLNNFIIQQVNKILEFGDTELISEDYLSFITNNYDFIINIYSKMCDRDKDKNIFKSLSQIAERINKEI